MQAVVGRQKGGHVSMFRLVLTRYQMSHARVQTTTTLLKPRLPTQNQTMILRQTTQMLKVKNRRKENLEDKASNQSKESNLNSKYLSVTVVSKYPDSLICFYCAQ